MTRDDEELERLRAEVERLRGKASSVDCMRREVTRLRDALSRDAHATVAGWDAVHTRLAAAEASAQKAITWLVTVRADQPAGIIADRARLALEALRSTATQPAACSHTTVIDTMPAMCAKCGAEVDE